jgi:hypothetical protein
MHRVAWGLAAAALLTCVAAYLVDRPYSVAAAIAAVTLLVACLVVAHRNGRRLERRWRDAGQQAELVLDTATPLMAGSTVRFTIEGTVVVDGQARARRSYRAQVPAFDAHRIVSGTRLPCTVLDEEPDVVRLHLRPNTPQHYIQIMAG